MLQDVELRDKEPVTHGLEIWLMVERLPSMQRPRAGPKQTDEPQETIYFHVQIILSSVAKCLTSFIF